MAHSASTRSPIPPWAPARSRLGAGVRRGLPQPTIDSLRADLTAARLADLLERAHAETPPFDPAHVAALRALVDALPVRTP